MAWARPDLTFTGLRGNIATRLTRIPDGGAIVMAAAAVDRLEIALDDIEHEVLAPSLMLPQVAQGALAVECRRDDSRTLELLAGIEHAASRRAVDAERGFLAELGGDCDLPAAAHAVGRFRTAHWRWRDCWRRSTVTSCCAIANSRREGVAGGRTVARYLLDDAGGAALLVR